jgi:hypothetical protein
MRMQKSAEGIVGRGQGGEPEEPRLKARTLNNAIRTSDLDANR